MRDIGFYRRENGSSPIEEFLDSLSAKDAQKVTWVLQLIEDLPSVPDTYLKKLVNTDDIWEVRIQRGNNAFRLLGFFQRQDFILLTNGFRKKSQKTPSKEIRLAEQRKTEIMRRNDE